MSDETKCPKCGASFYKFNPIGHSIYECRSVLCGHAEFLQSDDCRKLQINRLTAQLAAQQAENERATKAAKMPPDYPGGMEAWIKKLWDTPRMEDLESIYMQQKTIAAQQAENERLREGIKALREVVYELDANERRCRIAYGKHKANRMFRHCLVALDAILHAKPLPAALAAASGVEGEHHGE